MTRLRSFLDAVRALLRGEPVLAAAVLGVIVRSATTPSASPVAPSLPTDPTLPAETRPVLTLSGWRR
jgi:hypothetical protein